MKSIKPTIILLFLLFVSGMTIAQEARFKTNHTFLGSLHLSNYLGSDESQEYTSRLGIAIEYRKNIRQLSDNLHLSLGANLESLPIKRLRENEGDYFTKTQFNLTFPFGVYYTKGSYYAGMYTSLDVPFASKVNSVFNGVKFENTEFDLRALNFNLSGGLNAGKVIYIGNRQIHVELHFKALALLGLKSNDYWLYPEGVIPFYSGIKIGYGW